MHYTHACTVIFLQGCSWDTSCNVLVAITQSSRKTQQQARINAVTHNIHSKYLHVLLLFPVSHTIIIRTLPNTCETAPFLHPYPHLTPTLFFHMCMHAYIQVAFSCIIPGTGLLYQSTRDIQVCARMHGHVDMSPLHACTDHRHSACGGCRECK